MTAVGIDFGTTNSVVAHWDGSQAEALDIDTPLPEWSTYGFSRVMPSVFAQGAGEQALFGWAAKRADSHRFEAVKRLFATQRDVITDDAGSALVVEEVATMLFAQLRMAAAGQGVDPTQAVITVPANSRGLARHRTKICAGMAGLEVLALINEPTAAAMAYSSRNPGDQQLLVFDWGGGTLDVTILRSVSGVFMEQASKGLPTSGGLDFDSRLSKLVLDTVPDATAWSPAERHRLRLDLELAKIRLSEHEYTVVQLPGGDSRRITRAMFEDAISGLIDEARRPIQQCLDDIGAGPGSIDAVVMVGGTSKIPAVRACVAEMLGREPEPDIDPMTAVGQGAAIAAAIMTGELESNDFFVSTEHALGTVTFDPQVGRHEFSVLIPRNHKLPARKGDTYFPVFDEQEVVRIPVIEGDPAAPIDDPDNVILKEWVVDLPGEPGDPGRSFDITYDYDMDGILHVVVTDGATGAEMLRDDVSYGVSSDKRQLVSIAQRARQTVEDGTVAGGGAALVDDPEAAALLQRALVQVVPFLDETAAEPVRTAVKELENATPPDLADKKDALREILRPYSYLF